MATVGGGHGAIEEVAPVIRRLAAEAAVKLRPPTQDTGRLGPPFTPTVADADGAMATNATRTPGEMVAKEGGDGSIGVEVGPGPDMAVTLAPGVPTFL